MGLMNYPKKVVVGDITVRDGFQHEEKTISTNAKLWVVEQLVLAGFQRLEVTNLGNPRNMPQFADADRLLQAIHHSRLIKDKLKNVEISAVTIREKSVERACEIRQKGYGPDRIVFMVSTSESHHRRNSGTSLEDYWRMVTEYTQKAHENGIKVCGTVSTIWGCPIEGPTDLKKAVEFTRRFFDIGVDDVEHADHDGSAPPDKVFEYYSMIMDEFNDPSKHVVHFHVTRGWGLANVLAALQAGMTWYEGTLGGIGGQPANFVDDCPVPGTGRYYYSDPSVTGLVSTEDMVVMMDEMGIETGIDVDRLLNIGGMVERIVGRRLRSECVHTGRIPKSPTDR
jgi:hydroxymethylglutaryl-CoA lyase